ncbi:Flp family type IVb pilin [Roseomonas hellenica]|nr:Flp family type IVb pilin [Plastoroseomonas hellenica]
MLKKCTALRRFWSDRKAASAIEYGLIAALIALVIAAASTNLGTQIGGLFNSIATKLSNYAT